MVVCAHNGVKAYKGIEHEVALHSLIFAVRLWCGVLNEAEDVIQTAWHGSQLSKLRRLGFSLSKRAASDAGSSSIRRGLPCLRTIGCQPEAECEPLVRRLRLTDHTECALGKRDRFLGWQRGGKARFDKEQR
jgi:hypothetical protein